MITLARRELLTGAAAMAAMAMPGMAQASGLSADIDLLERIYETLHPGLYRYQTPQQFRERCAALKVAAGKPLDLKGQYLRLSYLLAQVRCGHTYANFFNQTKTAARDLIEPANKLPFHFTWIGGRMVVTANPLAIDGLSAGDEVVAVDGVPAAVIQSRLLPLVRADGANDDKRRKLLCVTGGDRIESFDVYYPLLFPSERSTIKLSLRSPLTRRSRQIAVTPVNQAVRQAMMSAGRDPNKPDYWTLTWPAPRTALITMPGWAIYDAKWDWKARLQSMFEEMAQKAATGLIIDLRDNEGGEDCGNELIAHLITTDLPLFSTTERRVRFRSTPADLNPYLDTWDRSFEHLGEGADDLGNGFFRLKNDEEGLKRISPKGPHFGGKVIVLSSAQNSSATFQFIDLMRTSGLARIYGQPTGGNQRGINGGSFFFVRLPHSGLEADLPLTGVFPTTPKPDAGLLPDVRIDPVLADVATGHDRVLQRALDDLA